MEVVLSEGWRVGGRIRWVFNEPGLSIFILKNLGEWIELRAAAQIVWVQFPQRVEVFAPIETTAAQLFLPVFCFFLRKYWSDFRNSF